MLDPRFPDSLLGTWVRVYPAGEGIDLVVLGADGVAAGSPAAVGAGGNISLWQIGAAVTEKGICFGAQHHLWCSAYRKMGDTLSLGNQEQTVLVRPRAFSGRLRGERLDHGDLVPPAVPGQ